MIQHKVLFIALILIVCSETTKGEDQVMKSQNIALHCEVNSSSQCENCPASAANDGDRYSYAEGKYWCGEKGSAPWTWQIDFGKPATVAKVYQVMGSDPHIQKNAPRDYFWQSSDDGKLWNEVPGSRVSADTRLFRIVKFSSPVTARYFRIRIDSAENNMPCLREVEMYSDAEDDVKTDPWFYAINMTPNQSFSRTCDGFFNVARKADGWNNIQTQYIHVSNFNESILQPEPRPLCAFISGAVAEFCQLRRNEYAGLEEVLKKRNLPMWGSCGGCQLLLILEQHGTKDPWVCPHCEWHQPDYYKSAPKPFIYGHIQCRNHPKCGEYACIMEKGIHALVGVLPDPVLKGIPNPHINESHMGEVKFLPMNWVLVATKSPEGRTVNQIMRVRNRYIYACQSHPEETGNKDSIVLFKNFLDLVYSWGGYNPDGKDVPDPSIQNEH